MRLKTSLVMLIGSLLLFGCTSNEITTFNDPYLLGNTPQPPKYYEAVPLENPLPLLNLIVKSELKSSTPESEGANFSTLMMQNGSVLTVWALGLRNWLWGYPPVTTQYFGNIRNWKIERSRTREHFRFINQQIGSCIEAYGNGLIHNSCDLANPAQEFELLPTASGAVVLRNLQQQRCVTYNPVSTTDYTTITMQGCTGESTPLKDQVWYIAPPLLDAIGEN